MQPTKSDSMPQSRRLAIILVILLLFYAIGETVSWLGLRILESRGKQAYAPTLTTEVAEEHREILGRVVDGRELRKFASSASHCLHGRLA